jgi:hypothetical protein
MSTTRDPLAGFYDRLLAELRPLVAPDHTATAAPAPGRRPARSRSWRRPRVIVPVAVVAALAVGASTVLALVSTTPVGGSRPASSAHAEAVRLLDRAALAAGTTTTGFPRKDQYVYWKVARPGFYTIGHSPKRHPWVSTSEAWVPMDTRRECFVRGYGSGGYGSGGRPGRLIAMPRQIFTMSTWSGHDTTLAWLRSLPTDPDVLLRRLYRATSTFTRIPQRYAPGAVFATIGDLLKWPMPAALRAALYRAAAKIPHVTLVPDAVDPSGRHGVAVGLNTRDRARIDLVLDPTSLRFLGTRTVNTRTGKTVRDMGWALLDSGVADRPGQRPR